MKSKVTSTEELKQNEANASNLQKLYVERIEKFFALVELSYALKTSRRIIQKK